MTSRTITVLLICVLGACDSGSAPSSSGDGDPQPSDGDDTMDGGDDADGGDDTGVPSSCAAPVGTYRYVVAPHLVSGPCVEPSDPPAEIAWFDSTKSHLFSVSSVDCTVSPTTTSDGGCTHEDLLSCADGSSLRTTCTVDEDGARLDCETVSDLVTATCTVAFTVERTSPPGACTPFGGIYTTQLQRTAGQDADGCVADGTYESTNDWFTNLVEGTTNCTQHDAVFADDRCSLTRDAECEAGDASTSHCEWNEDSSEAHCSVVAGPCAYELDLLR